MHQREVHQSLVVLTSLTQRNPVVDGCPVCLLVVRVALHLLRWPDETIVDDYKQAHPEGDEYARQRNQWTAHNESYRVVYELTPV